MKRNELLKKNKTKFNSITALRSTCSNKFVNTIYVVVNKLYE